MPLIIAKIRTIPTVQPIIPKSLETPLSPIRLGVKKTPAAPNEMMPSFANA